MTEMSTAIHEAGHTVMGYIVSKGDWMEIMSASIIPDDDSWGRVHWRHLENFDPYSCDFEESENKLQKMILIYLAGAIAEKIAYGEYPAEGADHDFGKAVDCTMAMPPTGTMFTEMDGIENYLDEMMGQTETILRKYWVAVERLAEKLIQSPHIEGEELSKIIEAALSKSK